MPEERLQKVLAAAGVGSRRACETLITEGRVAVDGQVVTELGLKVDAAQAKIEVDGRPIRDPSELATDVGGRAAGEAVALTVARGEQRVELNVVLDGASR